MLKHLIVQYSHAIMREYPSFCLAQIDASRFAVKYQSCLSPSPDFKCGPDNSPALHIFTAGAIYQMCDNSLQPCGVFQLAGPYLARLDSGYPLSSLRNEQARKRKKCENVNWMLLQILFFLLIHSRYRFYNYSCSLGLNHVGLISQGPCVYHHTHLPVPSITCILPHTHIPTHPLSA
jgi:hypothetical protein